MAKIRILLSSIIGFALVSVVLTASSSFSSAKASSSSTSSSSSSSYAESNSGSYNYDKDDNCYGGDQPIEPQPEPEPEPDCEPKPPVICGPNEEFNTCINGGCSRFNCSRSGIICIDPIRGGCKEGCRCKEGYLRDDGGTCIPEEKCPAICYGQNEVSGCESKCPFAEKCEGIGKEYTCPRQVIECKPACRCKDGYYRNLIGECISKEDCQKCTKEHEYFSCGGACDNVCATLSEQNQTNCPIQNIVCNKMCYCEPNYARDDDNNCVPIDKCPPKPPITCGPDEVYDGCVNGGCGRFNCSQPGVICIDLIEGACIEGCRCKEGYLRADDGTCIPEDQCPAICYGENEVSGCETNCPFAEKCAGIGKEYLCPREVIKCKPACRCKDGFYRNLIGECISKENCQKCTKEHEYFSCGGACDNVCATLSKQNQTNCPIRNIVCNKMCYCEEGYARDANKNCVPIEECNKNKNENGVKKFSEGNILFTNHFLSVASKMNPGVSAIYSPFSLLFLLAQLALYATGTSLEQLLAALNLNKNGIRNTIPDYLRDLNSQQNVNFTLAGKVYVNENYKLSDAFKKDTKDIFLAEAQNVDFSNPTAAVKIINDWVAKITRNLIKTILEPNNVDDKTRLVLVNAIYFKSNWRSPFKPDNTKKLDFYVNKQKNVTVDMMYQEATFNYAEVANIKSQVIELPYKNSNFSYLVCLPTSKDGLGELLNLFGQASFSVLEDAKSQLKAQKVALSLPSIETTTTTDLAKVLPELDITEIFKPGKSGLTGILEKPEELYVSSAIQKAIIIVNESGSEAAAANAIVVGVTSAQPIVETVRFNANHPYIYFILFKGTPIFCGIYSG